MDYEQALAFFHSAPRFKGNLTLRRMARLCALLGDPQKKLPFVHVAGTNGKGSTSSMIAAVLAAAGYKTGLFVSPYVTDFCERIQINGRSIERSLLCRVAKQVKSAAQILFGEGLAATEFELVTAAGLCCFESERCDIAVLEVGLGGRFDATNCIPPPLAAVLTKIALDHKQQLGDTLEQIAFEKCGIIKGGDVVCAPGQQAAAITVIERRCREEGAVLHQPGLPRVLEENFFPESKERLPGMGGQNPCFAENSLLETREGPVLLPLPGAHQLENFAAALLAVQILRDKGFTLPFSAVQKGIAKVKMPARLECVSQNPPVLLDGAHNPDGIAALLAYLGDREFTALFSAMADKDYQTSAALLGNRARRVIACALDMPRAASVAALSGELSGCKAQCFTANDFAEGYRLAREGLREGELIVVCGSFYLAAEARAYFVK